jgi:hypothetical protein
VVRLSIPLDRLFDDFERYSALYATTGEATAEALKLSDDMEEVFRIVCESARQIPDLLKRLQPVAGYGFEAYNRLES